MPLLWTFRNHPHHRSALSERNRWHWSRFIGSGTSGAGNIQAAASTAGTSFVQLCAGGCIRRFVIPRSSVALQDASVHCRKGAEDNYGLFSAADEWWLQNVRCS
jgi:hypothetical protein